MKSKERQAYIEEWILKAGKVSVSDISRICGVTEETVRRDLDRLESEGKITRIHGGAVRNEEIGHGSGRFYQRQNRNLPAKRDIAGKIDAVIGDKKTIMADSSSTVEEALKKLSDRPELTIVTNSAHIFQVILDAEFSVISTGGIYNKHSLSFQGEIAKNNIRSFNADIAMISCKALHRELGVLDSYENEIEIKKAMMNQASETALLVDHSKFDTTVLLKFADISRLNYIVTDRKPSDDWVDICKQRNITLIY